MYETINSPFKLGNVTLKNRIIFAPTSMGLKEEEYVEKLGAIARGGTAMIIIGDVPVLKSPFLSLYSKKGFLRYRRITETIHKNGALAAAQLHMSDSQFRSLIKYLPGMITGKIKPDEMRVLLNDTVSGYITGLTDKRIAEITQGFGKAAVLAKDAGFDVIQIHGDRMCGSFSSSIYNQRTDRYGGSAENRARFACEAVAAVRKALPDMTIDYKLAVRQEDPHYGNAGVLKEELPVFVPLLEQAGVNSFHVTLANHSDLSDTIPPASHPYFHGQGCFLPFCDEVSRLTDLPVCGVGRLCSPDFVEEQLKSGRIQLAAMSRQLIADPEWVKKTSSGAGSRIFTCTGCNRECLGGMQAHKGVHCIRDRIKTANESLCHERKVLP
ncbi:bilirubin reductase [Hungatella effluvii]|uniref:bilirubin reductase n=1 Tax=Hungatella effluvii TaxID=1096246 RepID=UPI0022E0B531|nr:bilirubin reductase [Hungatella effluvii]